MNRRDYLHLAALLPTVPMLSAITGCAASNRSSLKPDSPKRLVVIRLAGGNDALSTVVPFRDDVYYQARPNIALPPQTLLKLDGNDQGLHPALIEFKQLMDEGWAGVIQNVGYPNASRSHSRGTQIWSTGTTTRPAPNSGWLGRWADEDVQSGLVAGFTLGDDQGLALQSHARRTQMVAHPETLRELAATEFATNAVRPASKLERIRQVENHLVSSAAQFARASKASGNRYPYPDTDFGAALRWAANLIETGSTAQVFHVTLGSFETGFSFDTHLHQLAAHESLYAELGGGLKAFTAQLRKTGSWDDTLVMTYSEFGRQVAENNRNGTEHGDAGVMFVAGGEVASGLHGQAPHLAEVRNSGLKPEVDFRGIFATVLQQWLDADAERILGASIAPVPFLV